MDADRSNVEIKVLLRNLDTAKASVKHKDRLRRLNKFRNYVTARPPPEFYDDDHSLLLLGSDSPTAMEDEALSGMVLVGLLSASGCPSTDHKEALKRSARPAISLLRYLCLEFDGAGGITGEPNGFACALCALDVPRLRTMRLELHIGRGDGDGGGTRGGSKDDACALLALVLARHTDPDGGSPDPVSASDLLPEPRVRAEFERWLGENAGQDARRAIRENAEAAARPGGPAKAAAGGEDDGDEHDEDDVLGVFGIGKRGGPSDSSKPGGGGPARPGQKPHAQQTPAAPAGPPTAWSQTSMAEKRERASGAIFLEEEQKKDAEAQARAKEEKQRLLQRDPLGILGPGTFDLQAADAASEHLLRQTLREVEAEIEQELQLAGDSGVEKVNWLEAQRQAILAVSERRSLPSGSNISCSPTSPAFDPMLFLTLAHRTATYEELRESTSRLSRKTDSQVERLQNLVRENFPLFIKCSEGIDVFAEAGAGRADADGASADDGGRGERQRNLEGRFASLDALALSCADQARRSFKPLLDNTNEVRKVQSALSVLQRVAPLLQVPSLMRQHIENGNFSSAVKCYRKVLVIDRDNCDVDLLRHVRVKAGEAAQDARNDLELILADQESSADGLLDALRDLGELLELLEEEGENGDDAAGGGGGGGPADAMATPRSSGQGVMRPGTFSIDRHVICVRDYPPALACLLLQTSHFRSLVEKAVSGTEAAADRVFRGEGPDGGGAQSTGGGSGSGYSSSDGASGGEGSSSQRTRDKRWKFEVLEVRTDATLRAVGLAKNWLPRLIQIGLATQEAEKRALARNRRGGGGAAGGGAEDPDRARDTKRGKGKSLSAHSVFSSIVSPRADQAGGARRVLQPGLRQPGLEVQDNVHVRPGLGRPAAEHPEVPAAGDPDGQVRARPRGAGRGHPGGERGDGVHPTPGEGGLEGRIQVAPRAGVRPHERRRRHDRAASLHLLLRLVRAEVLHKRLRERALRRRRAAPVRAEAVGRHNPVRRVLAGDREGLPPGLPEVLRRTDQLREGQERRGEAARRGGVRRRSEHNAGRRRARGVLPHERPVRRARGQSFVGHIHPGAGNVRRFPGEREAQRRVVLEARPDRGAARGRR